MEKPQDLLLRLPCVCHLCSQYHSHLQTKNADVISQNYATTFEQIASPFHGYSTDNDYSHITLILLLDSFEINFSSLAASNERAKNPI